MPELPEVETIARTLRPLIQGAQITHSKLFLERSLDSGSLALETLQGKFIYDVRRRGKLALILVNSHKNAIIQQEPDNIHSPYMLAVHLKMTGRLFVYDANFPPQKHTRIILNLNHSGQQKQLFFDDARTFGYVRVLSKASLPQWPFWQKLGLEPLEHSAEVLAARYFGKKAGIKSLLLNQHLVVGIGNIYADEALFCAGLHPQRKADSIPRAQLIKLMHDVQAVLRLSIEQCGSSIRDYRDARGDAGSFQNSFAVYGRSGKNCVTCNSTLQAMRVAGRGTVVCPRCQK